MKIRRMCPLSSSLPHLSALASGARPTTEIRRGPPRSQRSSTISQRSTNDDCVSFRPIFILPPQQGCSGLSLGRVSIVPWLPGRDSKFILGEFWSLAGTRESGHTKKGLVSRSQCRTALMRLEFVVGQSRWGANKVAAGEGTIKRPWVGLALAIGDDPLQRLPSFDQSVPLSRLQTGILSSSPP